jgi:hypothetical protein
MHIRHYLAASVAAISFAAAMAAPAYAQETTASVRGSVDSASGPVAGATVTVTHVPSGTVLRTTTGADGGFSAQGMRIGGPFTVLIEADGYESARVTDLFLQAGTPFRLPVTLEEQAAIVVTASAVSGSLETSTGPITALSREEIEGVASINRDVRDLARRDPFATIDLSNSRTIEIAGTNGRLNRFSVDGVAFGDDFGLNNGGLPTNRGPVPLDAIEQFSVKVAPFDITEGNFQGGAINVVLRSGGNRLRGGAFYTYTDDSLTGDATRGTAVNLTLKSKQYGGVLSGPIVKDKLFFMVAYERTDETVPFDNGPQGLGFATAIPNLTQAQVDNVSTIARNVYSYDTLGILRDADENDEKLAVKLDWNISDDHRASLTYLRSVGTRAFQQNAFTTVQSPGLGLASNGYELGEEVNSGAFQLNSQWSDNFSTELRATYRDYNRSQEPFGGRSFGQFVVCLDAVSAGSTTACTDTIPTVTFGPDVSRHSNKLNTDNLGVEFKATLEAGAHSFKFLAGYSKLDTFNLFLQRSLGDWYFDSIADFQNRRASRFRLGAAVPSLNPDDAAANFSSQTYTIGLQDDWQVSDDLTVTLGARYDLLASSDSPPLNANFVTRYGFSNRETFTGKGVFQPRFGFAWNAADRLIVRGGVGVFAGGSPNVFLSNSYSNTGQLTNTVDLARNTTAAGCNVPTTIGLTPAQQLAICNGALLNVNGVSFSSDVTNFVTSNTASLAAATVNAIDPNLKLARQMRATLSVDYDADLGPFGDGWLLGANLLYGNVLQAYSWTDIRTVPIGTLPDGRLRYNLLAGQAATTNQDLLMTNDTRGRSYIGVVRFEKAWDFGLKIGGSYTRSDVKDVNAITSATAGSLYGNNAMINSNGAAYGRSIYEITDQWKFDIGFKTELFGDNETRFNLFGEYRSGRPYSLTLLDATGGRSPVFGTVGTGGNPLLYVPTLNDPKVSFATTADETNFNALVARFGLEKFRGSILPKNSQTSPDFFKVDLNVSQELPLFVGGAKLKLFADVENVLNLIDSDWGALRQVPFSYTAGVATVQCLSTPTATGTAPAAGVVNTGTTQTCAQYRYSTVRDPNINLVARQSLYGIRVGVKVSF